MFTQGTGKLLCLLRWHIDRDHTIDPGSGCGLGKGVWSHDLKRVQIPHEHDWRRGVICTELLYHI